MAGGNFDELPEEILQGTDSSSRTSGQFTVDWSRARHILARYQLEDPYTYVLKWVQWAIRSDATEVRVVVAGGTVSVEHDGVSPDRSLLPSPESWYGSGDAALQHLSIGCFAAMGLKPSALVLDCGPVQTRLYGTAPGRLPDRILSNRILVLGLAVNLWGIENIPLLFQRPMNDDPAPLTADRSPWDFFRDLGSLLRPESGHVRLKALYAPVPIWLNGRPINRPWFGFSSGYVRKGSELDVVPHTSIHNVPKRCLLAAAGPGLPGGVDCPESRLPVYRILSPTRVLDLAADTLAPWQQADKAWTRVPRVRLWGQQALPCKIISYYLAPHGKYISATEIEWVKDGVVVHRDINPIGVATGIRVVMSADDMSTDASQFRLVQDDAYRGAIKLLLDVWEWEERPG